MPVKSHLLGHVLLTPVSHPVVLTKDCTIAFLEWLQAYCSQQVLCGDPFPGCFILTCNIGPSPLGVALPSASESNFLSEPPFSARWQGRPVQPLPGGGVRRPPCTQQVRKDKLKSGHWRAIRLVFSSLSATSLSPPVPLKGSEAE